MMNSPLDYLRLGIVNHRTQADKYFDPDIRIADFAQHRR